MPERGDGQKGQLNLYLPLPTHRRLWPLPGLHISALMGDRTPARHPLNDKSTSNKYCQRSQCLVVLIGSGCCPPKGTSSIVN